MYLGQILLSLLGPFNNHLPAGRYCLNYDLTMTKKQHYEFGGPLGAGLVVVSLHYVIFALFFLCNQHTCLNFDSLFSFDWMRFFSELSQAHLQLTSWSLYVFIGWFLFQVLLERCLPGEITEGTVLPGTKDSKLKYTMNGHLAFWISVLVMGHAIPILIQISPEVWAIQSFRPLPLHLLYEKYVELIAASVIFSVALSIYLYTTSFLPHQILAKGGNTGNVIYDFFIGRELNPRINIPGFTISFDLKCFCELRPGLIGWVVLNLAMAFTQCKKLGYLTGSMLHIVLFQGFYVWDALYMEKAILTTMDITTDGFGYMLAFGDLAWVPFIYSLQARYLVDYDPKLSLSSLCLIASLHFLGYYIFRSANSQKDAFRRDPSAPEVAHLSYLQTKRGTRLITSGWWGLARKINYTGDWLITLSWCLLCGFASPIPYFQAVYFLILLVHRAQRDDHMCLEKYGEEDWNAYKKKVPYLFIPFVI